jgi:hypothetical protein
MCSVSEKYVESCAYHEAGHTVVAAALKMPLRNRGVHIDSKGCGISFYWFRVPGDLKNQAADIMERERTIVSTESGFLAQRKFYPDCPTGGNVTDRDQCIKLLDEMYPNREEFFAAQARLIAEAKRLVDEHWAAIETLGKQIWAQPWTPRNIDPERNWSEDSVEKCIDGKQVVSILSTFQLEPSIRDEAEGMFYPSVQPGSIMTDVYSYRSRWRRSRAQPHAARLRSLDPRGGLCKCLIYGRNL